jgi:hypothetical protein
MAPQMANKVKKREVRVESDLELAGFMAHAGESPRKNGAVDFLAIERGFRDAADGANAIIALRCNELSAKLKIPKLKAA